MDSMNQVKILDKAVCFSLHANALNSVCVFICVTEFT